MNSARTPGNARSVFANSVHAPNQDMKPPMLSNAVINLVVKVISKALGWLL